MTIAMMYSSFLPSLATGTVVFSLYGLAFVGGWVEQIGLMMNVKETSNIGIIVSLLMPSESLWRRASFEMQSPFSNLVQTPFSVISVPSNLMIWYAVFYMIITLFLTIKIFENRDL